jgi:DNA-binding IclR family transcriptional regulator
MQNLSGIKSVAAPVQATVGTTVVVIAGASARTRFLQAVVKRSQAALKRAAARVI